MIFPAVFSRSAGVMASNFCFATTPPATAAPVRANPEISNAFTLGFMPFFRRFASGADICKRRRSCGLGLSIRSRSGTLGDIGIVDDYDTENCKKLKNLAGFRLDAAEVRHVGSEACEYWV
jgi:hypothetical protein